MHWRELLRQARRCHEDSGYGAAYWEARDSLGQSGLGVEGVKAQRAGVVGHLVRAAGDDSLDPPPLGFHVVSEFIDASRSILSVFWVDSRMHGLAWDRRRSEEGRGLSFVDWTISLASHELRAHVFTYDSGFLNASLPYYHLEGAVLG